LWLKLFAANLIGVAVYRYQQEHDEQEYGQLIRPLFDELLPVG
jgi:hypothetical protein